MVVTAPATSASEQRITLHSISWQTYEHLLADHLDRSVPHFIYDQGALEIVCPSTEHEEDNRNLAHVVRTVAAAMSSPFRDVGSMTFKRDDVQRGFEADSTFYFQREPLVRGRRQIDLAVDPPPDLVIEIEVSRSALDKLAMLAQFGVPEVWRYDGNRVTIHVLAATMYQEVFVSRTLPPLTSEVLTRFLDESRTMSIIDWMQAVSDWARAHRVPDTQS